MRPWCGPGASGCDQCIAEHASLSQKVPSEFGDACGQFGAGRRSRWCQAWLAQVQVVDFKDRGPGAKVMIEVHVIVEAASQRGIMIGAGGSALKALGSAARVDIEEFLGALLCCEDKKKPTEDCMSHAHW